MPVHFRSSLVKQKSTSRDDDYVIPPHTTQEECVELKESDEPTDNVDKDYYFMDTTVLGQSSNIIMYMQHVSLC